MTDRKGLADRLEAIAFDDHERGCEGRNYLCSCGFDDREHDVLKEAAAALRQEPSVDEVKDAILDACRQYADTARAYVGERRDVHTGYILTEAAQAISSLYRGKP